MLEKKRISTMFRKSHVMLLLIVTVLSSCSNEQASTSTSPVTFTVDTADDESDAEVTAMDSITLLDKLITNSSYYLGSYDMSSEMKQGRLTYHSRFNQETFLDTSVGREYGYMGTVEIKNLSRKSFDFTIDLVAVNQCSGWVEGKAVFNAINHATSVQIDNALPEMCVLDFTFIEGKLIVQQSRCMDYHGKACQFEDVYLRKVK